METTRLEMLEDIDENGRGLTPWEVGFVADLVERLGFDLDSDDDLTPDQRDKIAQIHAERVR